MKTLLLILLQIASTALAVERCHPLFSDLGIPEQFEHVFKRYKDLDYVTPLQVFSFSSDSWGRYVLTLTTRQTYDGMMDTSALPSIKVHLVYRDRALTLENVTIAPDLDPEYAYRALMARLLVQFSDIQSVTYPLEGVPDYGVFKREMAMKRTLKKALKATPAYKAFVDFGFKLDELKSYVQFLEEPMYHGDFGVDLAMTKAD